MENTIENAREWLMKKNLPFGTSAIFELFVELFFEYGNELKKPSEEKEPEK